MPARPPLPRLLFLEALPTIAGGQAVLLSLVAALRGRYAPDVLLPGDGPLAERLRALGVTCHYAPMGRYTLVRKTPADVLRYAGYLPALTLSTWRLIRRTRPALVYSNSSRTFVWGTLAAALAGRGILWHQHNILADGKTIRLLRGLGRLRAVKGIVCVSAEAARPFAELGRKVSVVPPGVDVEHYRPDPALGAAARQRLGLPAEAPVIGLVGDLIPLKGQSTLIEAAREVAAACPEARCVLVGAPRPDAESQAYAEGLWRQVEAAGLAGRVLFAGPQAEMVPVYNALDVLVVASTTETVPLVMLEALACGVPVLSTPVGRAPELLADGTAGALYPTGDARRLAEVLKGWLRAPDTLASRGAAARALAEARLPVAQATEQVAGLIAAALPENHGAVH